MSFYIKKRKRLLKKTLVGASIFLFGTLALHLLSLISKQSLIYPWISYPLFPVFLMTLISILTYKPLDYLFSEIFKRFLFKKKSFTHLTLYHLVDELQLILDLQELSNLVVNTFGEVLHLKTVALVLPNPLGDEFEICSAFGWSVSDYRRITLKRDSALPFFIQENGPHVLVRNLVVRSLPWQEANQLAHDFDQIQAGWVIPLFVKSDLQGFLAFSSKHPDRIFDKTDFQFFREFAASLAKIVHNALSVRELKYAILQLQDTQSKLVQATKQAAIEQLATGIAHEIHNPLTIISGKAQVLLLQKDRMQMDERTEEVLKTIVKQTKRAADITRKLLMFSQGSGTHKEPLRLDQILDDTLALVSYQTALEGIEIAKSVSPDIPSFFGNVHEIREVFLNLILNAVQSIGSMGKIHVNIKFLLKDRIIEIQISDTGPGIEAEHIEKLFNPFFTTRDNALGLGLFVTKQIVHRYGGSIRVESRLGEGSLFIVRFPYTEPSYSNGVQNEAPLSASTPL